MSGDRSGLLGKTGLAGSHPIAEPVVPSGQRRSLGCPLLRLAIHVLPVAALTGVATAQVADPALVPVGAPWRWAYAQAGVTVPASVWTQPEFDDRPWPAGPSGFAFDYGQTEATRLVISRTSPAVCFRTSFTLDDPETVRWLVLRVDHSGGFIAWINGNEVTRRGFPGEAGTAVAYDQPGTPRVTGHPAEIDVSHGVPWLRRGTNVLAIQWHSVLPLGGGSIFVPELLANFIRGPAVQNTSTTRQHILWKTHLPASTRVEYGTSTDLGWVYEQAEAVTNHLARLEGLAADTTYHYRILSTAGDTTVTSPIFKFRTLRASGGFSFALTADMGSGTEPQYAIGRVLRNAEPDLVLVAGDLIYYSFTAGRADFRCYSVYGQQMRSTPWFVAPGNHDVITAGGRDFFDAFDMPTNNVAPADHAAAATGPEHYYSFDHGDAHFVAAYIPLQMSYLALKPDSAQVRWLEADLAASTKPWKFLFFHMPILTSNGHRNDDYNASGELDTAEVRRIILPLARRYGVQMILSGHAHAYERFHPVDGALAIVSGGGGGTLYGMSTFDDSAAVFHQRYQCVKVQVQGDALELMALDDQGRVFDRMYFHRSAPAPRDYTATWHAPVIETAPADDRDGNLLGQTFDFAGEPIPTAPGLFANVGRVYVNRDHDHLYLGFEQPMLNGNNTLLVFVDSPALDLAALEDHPAPGAEGGVGGLRTLGNLSFRGFRPDIACVLGDEYADGQFRSYLRTNHLAAGSPPAPVIRTNLALDTGQGVFRLDASNADVPGARIQQFNRSPQAEPFPWEQNANFIEVAIPLTELGFPPAQRSGQTLKLGAVVGGAGYSTEAVRPWRQLDQCFLGARLEEMPAAEFVLEGLTVHLGPDLDADGDGLLLAEEQQLGTRPDSPDSDGDGLDDGWEVRYTLDPLDPSGNNGPHADLDGDGLSNLDEQAAGSSPRDPASALRVEVARHGSNRVLLSWRSVAGRQYRLLGAERVTGPFLELAIEGWPRTGLGRLESLDLRLDGLMPPMRFLRLLIDPPPRAASAAGHSLLDSPRP